MSQELILQPHVQEVVNQNKSLEKLALRLFVRGGSIDTAQGYVVDVIRFSKWMNQAPDDLLKSKQDWASVLKDYIADAITKQKLSRALVTRVVVCVKKWLLINGSATKSDFEGVESPRITRVASDRLPTREELKKVIAASDMCDRVLALVAISSGLRESAILSIKLKQLIGLEVKQTGRAIEVRREKLKEAEVLQTREIVAVRVEAGQSKNRQGYVSFLTPEATEAIKVYLTERQLRGEELSEESYVVVSMKGRHPIDRVSAARRWRNMLRRAALDEKGDLGRVRWMRLHFHTLRKYFKSWTAMSGVPETYVEYMMGHRGSIGQAYFLPGTERLPDEILSMLEKEYRKAIPALSVMSETETVKKLEEQVEIQATQLEEERKRFEAEKNSWESRFEVVLKELRETRKALETK